LTDPKVFDAPYNPDTCEPLDQREFLARASNVDDVVLWREGGENHVGGARASIPQRYVHHSPTGFEWGYGGSGPADLALNILALFVAPSEAWRLHQDFKRTCIARVPREGATINADNVRRWILATWEGDEHFADGLAVHAIETGATI